MIVVDRGKKKSILRKLQKSIQAAQKKNRFYSNTDIIGKSNEYICGIRQKLLFKSNQQAGEALDELNRPKRRQLKNKLVSSEKWSTFIFAQTFQTTTLFSNVRLSCV